MSERVVTRLLCGRSKGPHVVGAMYATPDGFVMRYRPVVHGVPGPFEGPEIPAYRPTDELLSVELWCSGCRKLLPAVSVNDLFGHADSGAPWVRLTSENIWERLWTREDS